MIIFFKYLYSKYLSSYEAAYLLVGILLLGLLFMTSVVNILIPFIVSVVIVYLLQGLIRLCKQRLHLSHNIAVALVFLLFIITTISLIVLIAPMLYKQTLEFAGNFPALLQQLIVTIKQNLSYVPELSNMIKVSIVEDQITSFVDNFIKFIVASSFNSLDSIFIFFAYVVAIPTIVFFMLKDMNMLLAKMRSTFVLETTLPLDGKKNQCNLATIVKEIDSDLASYIRGKFIESLIVGIAVYIVFVSFDLQYSELLAFIVGLSVVIPYIGVIIATIPVLLLAIAQFGFGGQLYWLLGIYVLLQLVDANILIPVLFSEAVKIHPILIILAIMACASVWGFWGVFFAIPLAIFIKTIARNWPTNAWLKN